MTICARYEHVFWLDVHGELDPVDREDWERHLQDCSACRDEKADVTAMLAVTKSAMMPPPLHREAIDKAIRHIGENVHLPSTRSKKSKRRIRFPAMQLSVAAAACVLLISIGIITYNSNTNSPAVKPDSIAGIQEALPTEDLEIIRNLDLLTEFEAIEQLVQRVDHPTKQQPPATIWDEPVQGKIPGGGTPIWLTV